MSIREEVPANATYAKEFVKKVTRGGNLYPRGKRKALYDLGYELCFGDITWEEYEKKKKEIEKIFGESDANRTNNSNDK